MDIVPQIDLKAGYLEHKSAIDAAVMRVLESGWYVGGEEVAGFERDFAAWAGTKEAVAVANGTDALVLALKAFDLGPGSRVATVSHTAVATVAAIELAGLVPVLLDIDEFGCLDPAALDQLLSGPEGRHVRAVIPVHLYGQPADVAAIGALAARYGIPVLEDCAQAHGATFDGRKVGTFGRVAAYSLYPTKNLGALGDGGVIATDDAELAERLRGLREYGWRARYISAEAGQNSRLDPIQAAILRVKLAHLDQDNARRQAIARAYDAGLRGVEIPQVRPGATHVYHQYVIRHPDRESLRERLRANGVMSNVHYPEPVHRQPAYQRRVPTGSMTRTEALLPHVLSLPMYPQMTEAQVAKVIEAVRAAA